MSDTLANELPARQATRQSLIAWVPRALIALAVLAFIGYFVVYLIYAVELFRFPFDYDQGEGFELMDTVFFSRGQWPYRDNDVYPFYSSNYPPLFHVVVVPLVSPQADIGKTTSAIAVADVGKESITMSLAFAIDAATLSAANASTAGSHPSTTTALIRPSSIPAQMSSMLGPESPLS